MCVIGANAFAQDESDEPPLGDVARNLRKTNPHPEKIIDDENLSVAMQQAESRQSAISGLRYVMGNGDKDFRVAAPDVTCSLAFSSNAKSLLSRQYAQMEMPPAELVKIHGPATIEGDALTVSLFNGTDWHVSEIAVAVTIVKKADSSLPNTGSPSDVALNSAVAMDSAVRPEKKPDTTFIYHMRAAGAPWATTTFNAPLHGDLPEGEEWHWAIIQARGYPPENDGGTSQRASAQPLTTHDSSAANAAALGPSTPLPSSLPSALPSSSPATPPKDPQ